MKTNFPSLRIYYIKCQWQFWTDPPFLPRIRFTFYETIRKRNWCLPKYIYSTGDAMAKLQETSQDKRWVLHSQILYSNISLWVRCSLWGHLSGSVSIKRGVREGCILAPLLFNLYISSINQALLSSKHHYPILAEQAIPPWLYEVINVVL